VHNKYTGGYPSKQQIGPIVSKLSLLDDSKHHDQQQDTLPLLVLNIALFGAATTKKGAIPEELSLT
jgi:hypothetical protein